MAMEIGVPPLTTEQDSIRLSEIDRLSEVYLRLLNEYEGSALTTAQRIQALSEMRKTIQLRVVLEGLIRMVGGSDDAQP